MDRDFSEDLFMPGKSSADVDSDNLVECPDDIRPFGIGGVSGVDEDVEIISSSMYDGFFNEEGVDDNNEVNTQSNKVEDIQTSTPKIDLKSVIRSNANVDFNLPKSDTIDSKELQEDSKVEDPAESIFNLNKKELKDFIECEDDLVDRDTLTESKPANDEAVNRVVKFSQLLKSFLSNDGLNDIEQRTHKIKVIVIVLLTVFLIVSGIVTGIKSVVNSKKDITSQTQSIQTPVTNNLNSLTKSNEKVLRNGSFSGLSEMFEDILIVDKYAKVTDDGVVFYLGGETTKLKAKVSVPVTLDTYNKIENGSLLKLGFRVIKIDNTNYCTEYELMEVIE